MKIYFASDHAGFELKNILIGYVDELGYDVEDIGARAFNQDDDYPDFIIPLAERVASESESMGIIIGKSGQGEAMCANRTKGARAIVFYGNSTEIIKLGREDNNANILSLGAQFVSPEEAKSAVKQFIDSTFSDLLRHSRRLAKF